MTQSRTLTVLGCAVLGLFLVGYGCGGGGSGEEEPPPPGDGLDGGATSGAGGSLGQGGAGSQPNPSGGGSSGTAGRTGGGSGGTGAGGAGGLGGRPMGIAGAGGFGGRPMGIAGAGGFAGRDGARDGGADRGNANQCQAGNMCTQNCTRACLSGARPGMQSCVCNNGQYFCGGCDPTDAGLPEVPQNFICPAGTAAGAACMMRGQSCLLQGDGAIARLCNCGGDAMIWTCRGN